MQHHRNDPEPCGTCPNCAEVQKLCVALQKLNEQLGQLCDQYRRAYEASQRAKAKTVQLPIKFPPRTA